MHHNDNKRNVSKQTSQNNNLATKSHSLARESEKAPREVEKKPRKVISATNDQPKVLLRDRTRLQPSDNSPFKLPGSKPQVVIPRVPIKMRAPLENHFQQASMVKPIRSAISADSIQSRLKKKSPWFDSIMSPISGGGVKIPDPIGTNTGTYQHVQNVTVGVNAAGISGLRICSPYINQFVKTSANGSNYQVTGTTSTLATTNWGPGGAIVGDMIAFNAIPALMKANAQSHRVVSAAVTAQAEISSLNDSGEMCSFVTPFRCNAAAVPYSSLTAQWDSAILPVNAKKPLIARWYPVQSDWDPFTGSAYVPGGDSFISYQDFVNPFQGIAPELGCIPWEFGIICTGMAASTGVVRFQIIVNYEFIPATSTAMVTQAPSPIDPMEEQLVNGWVASTPMTGIVSQFQAAQAPADSKVPEEETGFGMFADVVKQLVPIAVKGLSML
jgi:hypothetical protein